MPEKTKGIMVRVPEHIHHKLKILAAMQQKSMADVIVGLVERETIQHMDNIPVIKSLLGEAAGFDEPATQKEEPGTKTRAPKRKPIIKI